MCLTVSRNVFHSNKNGALPVECGLAKGDDRSAGLTHPPGDG